MYNFVMSNINPMRPKGPVTSSQKVESEVKGLFSSAETQASSSAASKRSEIEASIRDFFIQKFGVTKGTTLANAAIKDLTGKDLSYRAVKEVILGAARSGREELKEEDVDNFLKPLFPSEDDKKFPKPPEREFDPESAAKFQNKKMVEIVKKQVASEEATLQEDVERARRKEAELKEMENREELRKHKPMDPEKRV